MPVQRLDYPEENAGRFPWGHGSFGTPMRQKGGFGKI
jgi:hypothetical protein